MCHLEGDSMHSMTTNDERFYDKYEKFRPDCRHIKIWHERDKNIHQDIKKFSYSHPFELGKGLEHEEEDKWHD